MAQVENELLQQARASLRKRELDVVDQKEADLICAVLRKDCEELLGEKGQISRSISTRVLWGMVSLTGIGTVAAGVVELVDRALAGYHVWESNDRVKYQTSLNGTEPKVAVDIVSKGTINPIKAEYIDVKVEGLPESLRLIRRQGHIYNTGYYEYFNRKANLEDAQKWQKLITELREHPVT